MPSRSIFTTAAPARRQSSSFVLADGVLRGAVGQGHAERFDRGGHGVGGVHAAAGARAGNRGRSISSSPSPVIFPVACAPTASNTETMSRRCVPGQNGAAIDEDGRTIQARHGHRAAGHVLVATADGDEAVEARGTHDGFDGIGDDFARDERVFHAFGAHGDAVGDGDGVEEHALAARRVAPLPASRASLSMCMLHGVTFPRWRRCRSAACRSPHPENPPRAAWPARAPACHPRPPRASSAADRCCVSQLSPTPQRGPLAAPPAAHRRAAACG